MLVLFVLALGTAVLVPWGVRWQGLLTSGRPDRLCDRRRERSGRANGPPSMAGAGCVGAFALSFTALKDHYRSQDILIDALLYNEKCLAKSETMLRTLFDAVPDIVTLTRFVDGKLFEVNAEFLKCAGLSRERRWRHGARSRGLEKRTNCGTVHRATEGRGPRTEFRDRFPPSRGARTRHLLSSVVVEIDGELHALNVARDATSIKENERALREAQERLRAQVEELTATQGACAPKSLNAKPLSASPASARPRCARFLRPAPTSSLSQAGAIFGLSGPTACFSARQGTLRRKSSDRPIHSKFWANLRSARAVQSSRWIATASHTTWRPTSRCRTAPSIPTCSPRWRSS